MSPKRFCPIFLGLFSLSLASGVTRAADVDQTQPTSQPDLQTQVNALNAEVQELKAQQNSAASSQTPSEPTTQNAPSVIGGGWNPTLQQFYIGNPNGNFYFHPGIIFQGRYDADWHRSPDKWTNGFELRCW